VFSVKGWLKVYPYLKEDCTSGWGYDLLFTQLVPDLVQGVVHCESVGHMEYKNCSNGQGPQQLAKLENYYGMKVNYNVIEKGDMK
jgi:hypothetical protein